MKEQRIREIVEVLGQVWYKAGNAPDYQLPNITLTPKEILELAKMALRRKAEVKKQQEYLRNLKKWKV